MKKARCRGRSSLTNRSSLILGRRFWQLTRKADENAVYLDHFFCRERAVFHRPHVFLGLHHIPEIRYRYCVRAFRP